jgi:hypothetical protein
MRTSRLILIAAIPAGVLLLAGTALATHKSWYLTDTGANCRATNSGSASWFVFNDGAITNNTQFANTVKCPITLAGRFASQPGPPTNPQFANFPVARWAAADHGTIWGFDGSASGDLSCRAWAFASTGSTYYSNSSTVSANNSNVQLDLYSGSWGGTLGLGSTITVRAMGYDCSLPAGSSIYGYRVNICQRDANCFDGAP